MKTLTLFLAALIPSLVAGACTGGSAGQIDSNTTDTTDACDACDKGYAADVTNDLCTICTAGSNFVSTTTLFTADANVTCSTCSTKGDGQSVKTACSITADTVFECDAGYTGDGASCTACESGKYKTDKGSAACKLCSTKTGALITSNCTASADTVFGACDIANGYTKDGADKCKKCSTAGEGQVEENACTATADATFNCLAGYVPDGSGGCKACEDKKTYSADPTLTTGVDTPGTCTACSTRTGALVTSECTTSKDTVFGACDIDSGYTKNGDAACKLCSTKTGALVTSACTASADTVFGACDIAKGYTKDGDKCKLCTTQVPTNQVKDANCTADADTTFKCDATNNFITNGSGGCKCKETYYSKDGTCTLCDTAGDGQVATDVECTATTNAVFQCDKGYAVKAGKCVACTAGTNYMDKTNPLTTDIDCKTCTPSQAGDVVTSVCSKTADTVINACAAGFAVKSGKCEACTAGTNFMDVQNLLTTTADCKACTTAVPDNKVKDANCTASTDTTFKCDPAKNLVADGAGCKCKDAYYSKDETCTLCTTAGDHQVPTDVECTPTTDAEFVCDAGYTLDATSKKCTACGSGEYKAVPGNEVCTPCDTAKTGEAPTAIECTTTQNAEFQCAVGYYSKTEVCTKCSTKPGAVVTSQCSATEDAVFGACDIEEGYTADGADKCKKCSEKAGALVVTECTAESDTEFGACDIENGYTADGAEGCKACKEADPLKGEYIGTECTATSDAVISKCEGLGKVYTDKCVCPTGKYEDDEMNCQDVTEATTKATEATTAAPTTTTAKKAGDSDSIGAGSSLLPHFGGVIALLMMVIALVL